MDIQDTYTLRGICMLMIIVHHVLRNAPFAPWSVGALWGDLGTAVFFFISGWGLYCSMEKRVKIDWSYFGLNIKKLIVPFLVVWLVTEVIYQFIHPELAWSGYGKIWFIEVISGAYIASILTFMLVKNRPARVSIVLILCAIYIYIAGKVLQLPSYRWCSSFCFPFGMWLSAYKNELKSVLSYKWVIAVVSAAIYVVFVNHNYFPIAAAIKYEPAFCMLAVSLISIFNIQSKILYYVGKKSLLFYLIHIAVLLLITEMLGGVNQHHILIFGVVLGLTFAFSWAYTKVEDLLYKSLCKENKK